MTSQEAALLGAIETHDVEELRRLLASGIDARAPVKGKSLVQWLLEMYFRSDRFPACLQLLLDHGGVLCDPKTAAVLLDDEVALKQQIAVDRSLLAHRTSLVSAFTPLCDASLLHVACEYGHVRVAKLLIDSGAEVDARAGTDECGLNGHTPLFHTVNSNANRSAPLMELLLDAGADATHMVRGITWGRGFEWETVIFDVTPISYAQMGLLPQMHRNEVEIYDNVRRLLSAASRRYPAQWNVPNRYLHR